MLVPSPQEPFGCGLLRHAYFVGVRRGGEEATDRPTPGGAGPEPAHLWPVGCRDPQGRPWGAGSARKAPLVKQPRFRRKPQLIFACVWRMGSKDRSNSSPYELCSSDVSRSEEAELILCLSVTRTATTMLQSAPLCNLLEDTEGWSSHREGQRSGWVGLGGIAVPSLPAPGWMWQ